MQWHAMAVVLGELAQQPPSSVTERAWNVIDAIKWDEPEDRAGRILAQSIKRLLIKAQAHRKSQKPLLQTNVAHPEQSKSPLAEEYFTATSTFDPALLGHNYHGPTNFVNVEDHHPAPFYMEQHISPYDQSPQQPVANWYLDASAIQPLQEQEPMVFNTEYWKGWDMIRDDPIHRRSG
jgi:hypothetical protein